MRHFFFTILLGMGISISHAQNIHVFASAGMMNYQGDLQPRRITMSQAHPYFGAGLYYEVMPKLYIKLAVVSVK